MAKLNGCGVLNQLFFFLEAILVFAILVVENNVTARIRASASCWVSQGL